MTLRRLLVGERVLVSRDDSGENHEEGTVVDYYELLIGAEKRPMVVVDFDDGERKWLTAAEPIVLAIDPEEEEEAADDEDEEGGEADDDAGADDEGSDPDEVDGGIEA